MVPPQPPRSILAVRADSILGTGEGRQCLGGSRSSVQRSPVRNPGQCQVRDSTNALQIICRNLEMSQFKEAFSLVVMFFRRN